ncbi:MAG: class I SAM-dependent methyltransferase, partial [Bacteroidia bacterium]
MKVRSLEQRVYNDEHVSQLPDIHTSHVHYNEWKLRKLSAQSLLQYLQSKNQLLEILEVGCGNGWLSAKMAGVPKTNVTGWDVNETELEQAKRVFTRQENLTFSNTSILIDS